MQKAENAVALDVAEAEWDRLCEMWDLDTSPSELNEDEKSTFSIMRKKIIGLVMQGRACVDTEKGAFKYTLTNPIGLIKELSFRLPKGGDFEKADKCKDTEDVKRNNTIIALMIKEPLSVAQQIEGVDYKVARTISSLFMSL